MVSIQFGLMISIEYVSLGQIRDRRMLKFVTIIEKGEAINMNNKNMTIEPVTPGELLNEEFLLPLGITKYRLAKEIGVPAQRVGEIVAGRRSITADTDLRLCRYFGLSAGYWLRLQNKFDTEITRRKISDQLENISP